MTYAGEGSGRKPINIHIGLENSDNVGRGNFVATKILISHPPSKKKVKKKVQTSWETLGKNLNIV